MFTPEQIEALKQPLSGERVKQRRQSGRLVSYLEGYDVIDSANELFGFDGWSYSVLDVQYVRMGDIGFYQATIKVQVGSVERTDVGFCDVAFQRDRGLDSAIADAFGTAMKGAVTDGLKRALRTFGNQFGNSLYDKDDPAHAAASDASHQQGASTPFRPGQPGGVASATANQQHADEQRGPVHEPTMFDGEAQACPGCGSLMSLRSGTTRDGRPYTAWFCSQKCGQKPLWINERKAS